MKFLYIFITLIFLYSCKSAVSNQNSIEKIYIDKSKKKMSIMKDTESIFQVKKELVKCQNTENYFENIKRKYFVESIFLFNLKKIENIDIYYKDNYGNVKKKSSLIKHTFEDDFVVISEDKQYNALSEEGIKLVNSSSINLFYIKYLDNNNNYQYKTICIDVEDRNINSNNLFIYENKYYFYNFDDNSLKNKQPHEIKPKLSFKRIHSSRPLKISYGEDDKYFYLKISGCGKINKCKNPKYIRSPKSKKAILKFAFNGNQAQILKNNSFSKYIKRIEIGYHSNKVENNHLVIESKKRKITNITKIHLNDKESIYRIEF